jgi:RNA polymerase sigma factor (TIGR02999 family)
MNDSSTPTDTDALFTEVYSRLKAMASRRRLMGNAPTINTTELVHETYVRMQSVRHATFDAPERFFAYAVRAMRHILLDAARERMRIKAGGAHVRLEFSDPAMGEVEIEPLLALQLDAGIEALRADDERAARVVELHYFAGLSIERVAELLRISLRTAHRDWQYARAFLREHVHG